MATIAEVLEKPWNFSETRSTKGGLRLNALLSEDGVGMSFLLGSKGQYPATIPFAPSSFDTSNSLGKKTLVFNVSDDVYDAVLTMEQRARDALGIEEHRWNSALKPAGTYAATLRVKYCDPLILGEDRKTTKLPDPWYRLGANALIHVKGVYSTARTGSGLMLEVTQMQIRPDESQAPMECVF